MQYSLSMLVLPCRPKKKIFIVIQFHHSRSYQYWDYNSLIQAGGYSPRSINMARSQDYGLSVVEMLTDIPYGLCGSYEYTYGGCLVIVNETTVFVDSQS